MAHAHHAAGCRLRGSALRRKTSATGRLRSPPRDQCRAAHGCHGRDPQKGSQRAGSGRLAGRRCRRCGGRGLRRHGRCGRARRPDRPSARRVAGRWREVWRSRDVPEPSSLPGVAVGCVAGRAWARRSLGRGGRRRARASAPVLAGASAPASPRRSAGERRSAASACCRSQSSSPRPCRPPDGTPRPRPGCSATPRLGAPSSTTSRRSPVGSWSTTRPAGPGRPSMRHTNAGCVVTGVTAKPAAPSASRPGSGQCRRAAHLRRRPRAR